VCSCSVSANDTLCQCCCECLRLFDVPLEKYTYCHFHHCLDACLLISVDFVNTDVVFAITCGGELRHGESKSSCCDCRIQGFMQAPRWWALGSLLYGIFINPYQCSPSKGADANTQGRHRNPNPSGEVTRFAAIDEDLHSNTHLRTSCKVCLSAADHHQSFML